MLAKWFGRGILTARPFILEQLEERIVLDAAVDAGAQDQHNDQQAGTDGGNATAAGANEDATGTASSDAATPTDNGSENNAAGSNGNINVVLISNALDQTEALSEAATEQAEVIVYDASTDDLSSINAKLQDLVNSTGEHIEHLAIFSHGSAGILTLSENESWSAATVTDNPSAWTALGLLLSEGARVDLYGCDVGQGSAGIQLVQAIASVTGATVWASNDATGNVESSNWTLEVHSSDSSLTSLIDPDQLDGTAISLSQSFGNVGFETGDTTNWGVSGQGNVAIVEGGSTGNPASPYVGSDYIAHVWGSSSTQVKTLASQAFITNSAEVVKLTVRVDSGLVKWGIYVMGEGRLVPGTSNYEIFSTGGLWQEHTVDLSWFFTADGQGRQAQIHIDVQGYGGSSSQVWLDLYETQNPYVYQQIPQQNGTEDHAIAVDLDPITHYFRDDHDTGNLTYSVVGYSSSFLQSASVSGDILTLTPKDNKSGYTEITVQAMDTAGLTEVTTFTAYFAPVNDAPTDIGLNHHTVDENQPSGTTVGTFSTTDPDTGDSFSYQLVSGTGGGDNSLFVIDGSTLKTNSVFDYESRDTYSIRVQSTDGGGLSVAKVFTININNINDAPTDIGLTPHSVNENQPSGTTVGTFSTTDPDTGDSFSYQLVSGTGGGDNSLFVIDGSTLKTNSVFDYESRDTYSVRVESRDSGGKSVEKVLNISVSDRNEAPTNIGLSSTDVDENQATGTAIGSFSTTDPDTGDIYTYSFVDSGTFTDNNSFIIDGTTLETGQSFDFEAKSSYTIKVKSTDSGGLSTEKQFTITVNDINDAPTNLTLSNATLDENLPSGTVVGHLSADDQDGDTLNFALVDTGSYPDNAAFAIDGSTLKTTTPFDFETQSSYDVRVRTTDGNGGFLDKTFTISVDDKNETPTDIILSVADVDENEPAGTTIGDFSTTDQDVGDPHIYSFVDSATFTDNNAFTIDGGTLKAAQLFDFEGKSSYTIKVKSTDGGGLFTEKQFTITVNDVNDAPDDITLSNLAVNENLPSGTAVGELFADDQDAGDSHTFSLVETGTYPDNGAFTIDGSTLKTAASFDFEARDSYTINVQTTDAAGATYSETFVIHVNDVNESPQLDNSGASSLDPVDEDDANNTGTLVSDLIASGAGGNPITDQDSGALEGIAVIGADTSHGSWQYTTDGSHWFDLGAVTETSARILASDGSTALRFVPDTDYNGTVDPAITYRAWDQTTGNNAEAGVDVSLNGGATAFSSASETARITVDAVNDAPVNTLPADQSMDEDGSLTFSALNGNAITLSDVDVDDGTGELQVHLTTHAGTLKLSQTTGLVFDSGNNGTGDMTFTGLVVDINQALDGMTFTPTHDYFGTARIDIVTTDLGNTGKPGALITTDVLEITVADVPEPETPAPHFFDPFTDFDTTSEPFQTTTGPDMVVDTILSFIVETGLFPLSGNTQDLGGSPGYEGTSGVSIEASLENLLNQAIFGQDTEAGDQAWARILGWVDGLAHSSSEPEKWSGLGGFFASLEDWLGRNPNTLDFNADERALWELLESIASDSVTFDDLDSSYASTGFSEHVADGTTLVFDLDAVRVADVFSPDLTHVRCVGYDGLLPGTEPAVSLAIDVESVSFVGILAV